MNIAAVFIVYFGIIKETLFHRNTGAWRGQYIVVPAYTHIQCFWTLLDTSTSSNKIYYYYYYYYYYYCCCCCCCCYCCCCCCYYYYYYYMNEGNKKASCDICNSQKQHRLDLLNLIRNYVPGNYWRNILGWRIYLHGGHKCLLNALLWILINLCIYTYWIYWICHFQGDVCSWKYNL